MHRHPFDAISFFFGLLFTAGAVSALVTGDAWPFGHGRIWPILLIAGGVILVFASIVPTRERTEVVAVPGPMPSTDPDLAAAYREVDEHVAGPGPVPDFAPEAVDGAATSTAVDEPVAIDAGEASRSENATPADTPVDDTSGGTTSPDEER
jgi:hypothetical protein